MIFLNIIIVFLRQYLKKINRLYYNKKPFKNIYFYKWFINIINYYIKTINYIIIKKSLKIIVKKSLKIIIKKRLKFIVKKGLKAFNFINNKISLN